MGSHAAAARRRDDCGVARVVGPAGPARAVAEFDPAQGVGGGGAHAVTPQDDPTGLPRACGREETFLALPLTRLARVCMSLYLYNERPPPPPSRTTTPPIVNLQKKENEKQQKQADETKKKTIIT